MLRPIVKYGDRILNDKAATVEEITTDVDRIIDEIDAEEEGCLSLPGFTATVLRPRRVTVRALDRQAREHFVEGKDLLARALQHEIDHLDGTLFVDRLRGISRRHIVGRIQKLRRAGRW